MINMGCAYVKLVFLVTTMMRLHCAKQIIPSETWMESIARILRRICTVAVYISQLVAPWLLWVCEGWFDLPMWNGLHWGIGRSTGGYRKLSPCPLRLKEGKEGETFGSTGDWHGMPSPLIELIVSVVRAANLTYFCAFWLSCSTKNSAVSFGGIIFPVGLLPECSQSTTLSLWFRGPLGHAKCGHWHTQTQPTQQPSSTGGLCYRP